MLTSVMLRFFASLIGPTCNATTALTAAFPAKQGAEVVVGLRNGKTIRQRLDNVIAATPQQIRVRFRQAAADVVGSKRALHLEELVDNCESLSDSRAIAAQCRLESTERTVTAGLMINNSEQQTGSAMSRPGMIHATIPATGPARGRR